MNKKIGFIGCGNMSQAIVNGIIKSNLVSSKNIMVADLDLVKLNYIEETLNIQTSIDNNKVVEFSDIVILCVKPQHIKSVMAEIKDKLAPSQILVSIAAGISIADIELSIGKTRKIVRVMPNTPALVGEGCSALCKNDMVSNEEFQDIIHIFESFGIAKVVDENLIDAVIGVSGSSPAYVYMFIEALADGAVKEGLPRREAIEMAAQAVLGSAKMVLESGKHPGELKDNVCSPGGTTIAAVESLERDGFRGSVMKAVSVAAEKNREMSK